MRLSLGLGLVPSYNPVIVIAVISTLYTCRAGL